MSWIREFIMSPLMIIGGLCLHIAWKLDPEKVYFYEWLDKYGYYYPEEENPNWEQDNGIHTRKFN